MRYVFYYDNGLIQKIVSDDHIIQSWEKTYASYPTPEQLAQDFPAWIKPTYINPN